MSTSTETIEQLATREYKYGFYTDVESETIPKGLSEDVVRLTGMVRARPDALVAVSPRYAGVVRLVAVQPGDLVDGVYPIPDDPLCRHWVIEQDDRAGTGFPAHSATGLAAAVSLPRDYLTVTPFRLLEGFCDPTTAALGPAFVYAGTGQGPSPHAGGNWYWSDFGWDGLRAVLSNMTHRVVVYPFGSPIGVSWWWDAADGTNEIDQRGAAQERWQRLNPGPDSMLESGDLAAALADAASNASATTDSNEVARAPYYIYSHRYFSRLRAEVADGDEYSCEWAADFRAVKARPAIHRDFAWPPAGVVATTRIYADVESFTAPTGQSAWTTEELDTLTASTPSTGWVVADEVVSHTTLDTDLLPGDPATTQGLPLKLALEGQDLIGTGFDYDEIPGSERGNMLRNSKEWRGPFAVIQFEWSYP